MQTTLGQFQETQAPEAFSLQNSKLLKVRLDAGTANFHEVEDAREQANERYNGLLDASFELQRARIALLRVTGELAKWVSGQK